MRVVEDLSLCPGGKGGVVTLGNFDGVHVGHREILRRVTERARGSDTIAAVFTFREHPLLLLTGKAPPLLTTLPEKYRLLEEQGIDLTACVPFTREMAGLSAAEFVENILWKVFRPRHIIVGHDYTFGKGRSGDAESLHRWAPRYGYELEVVEAVTVGNAIVSSTAVRRHIAAGRVGEVKPSLGRHYDITARVVPGTQKGKDLAFRTANLAQQPKLLPKRGVYAVRVEYRGGTYDGVANIGVQPTYGNHDLQVEVHLLDLEKELYGETLKVAFLARLRGEKKFDTVAALNRQIGQDVLSARKVFAAKEMPQAHKV